MSKFSSSFFLETITSVFFCRSSCFVFKLLFLLCTYHLSSQANENTVISSLLQVIKMLIAVILVFLICWGPQLFFRIVKYSEYGVHIYTETHFKLQVSRYVHSQVKSVKNILWQQQHVSCACEAAVKVCPVFSTYVGTNRNVALSLNFYNK